MLICSFNVLWDRRYNSQRSLVMFLFKQNCLPQANQYGWLTCVSHCLCDFITVCVEAPASSCFMFVEHQERLRKLPGFRLCCSEKKNVSGINISTLVHREKELGTNDTNGQYSVKGRVYWFEREKNLLPVYIVQQRHTHPTSSQLPMSGLQDTIQTSERLHRDNCLHKHWLVIVSNLLHVSAETKEKTQIHQALTGHYTSPNSPMMRNQVLWKNPYGQLIITFEQSSGERDWLIDCSTKEQLRAEQSFK